MPRFAKLDVEPGGAGSTSLRSQSFNPANCAAIMHRPKPKSAPDAAKGLAVLTDRQQQVAALVCDGHSSRVVAKNLGVTEGTVKCHLHAIYQKLGIHSRMELMVALAKGSNSKPG
jgi:DNA-binding NarL/FixJ family response regulator